MCGEHKRILGINAQRAGSSPHVRGAPPGRWVPAAWCGIIPACAGSTAGSVGPCCVVRDHPRMCGEHTPDDLDGRPVVGSSPHVRGAPVELSDVLGGGGIIPACAGSTPRRIPMIAWLGDHPRMCGEHKVTPAVTPLYSGSSPHVRGAPVRVTESDQVSGIIPACAGSTSM